MKTYRVSSDDLFEFEIEISDNNESVLSTVNFFTREEDNPVEYYLKILGETFYYYCAEDSLNRIIYKFDQGIEGFSKINGEHGIKLLKIDWFFDRDNIEIKELK